MPITTIEKAAKLMGYEVESVVDNGVWIIEHDKPLNCDGEHPIRLINPYTSKSDLMDVECALGIDIEWRENYVQAWADEWTWDEQQYADHPDKFTARAHAVMAVVEQIYDARFGKDGE